MAVRRVPLLAILAAALGVFALAAAAFPVRTPEAQEVRTVVLEAKGTGFYDVSDPARSENPAIEARAGERIRIVVRNADPGVLHAIGAPTLEPGIEDVRSGEEAVVEFTAASGEHEYVCTHHYPLMKGRIIVR